MAEKTVEQMTKKWKTLGDYHALRRVADNSNLSINTLKKECTAYRSGTKTAKEIRFIPHWICDNKLLLIEPID